MVCHKGLAFGSRDEDAAEAARYWWDKYEATPWWRPRARREALGKYRQWRDDAVSAGLRPPPAALVRPLDLPE